MCVCVCVCGVEGRGGEVAPRKSLRRLEFAPPRPASKIYIHANKPERTVKLSGPALLQGRKSKPLNKLCLPLQLLKPTRTFKATSSQLKPVVAQATSRRIQGSWSVLHERGNATKPLGKRNVCNRLVCFLRHGHALQGKTLTWIILLAE